jgi:ParB-like chromosome segregation protein Spo0J
MEVKNRIKAFKMIERGKLRPRADNFRLHPEIQQAALTAAVQEFGITSALLVRPIGKDEYEILDGHLRLDVLPNTKLPCLVLDVNDEEARKILLTHDAIAELAVVDPAGFDALAKLTKFDNDVLSNFISQIQSDSTISAIEAASAGGESDEDDDSEESEDDDESDVYNGYKTFSVQLTDDQHKAVLAAVKESKARHGAETSGEALSFVCRDWCAERKSQ